MLPVLDEECQKTIGEILKCGSGLKEQANILFNESDVVDDPMLRGDVREVAREAVENLDYASDVVLDIWKNNADDITAKALRDFLETLRKMRRQVDQTLNTIRNTEHDFE